MPRKKKKPGANAGNESRPGQKDTPSGKGKWMRMALPLLALIVIGVAAGWLLTGPSRTDSAGSSNVDSAGPKEIQLVSFSQLPDKVRKAPPVVQEAYRFALSNPETLSKLPCYCSCGNVGHESNLDCFASEINDDGSVVFDYHALG